MYNEYEFNMAPPKLKAGGLAAAIILIVAALLAISPMSLAADNATSGTTASVSINETVSISLANTPIQFGNLDAGVNQQPAQAGNGYPLQITVKDTTNVDVNVTLNGSDFDDGGGNTFGITNLTYSNTSTTPSKTNASATYPAPTYSDWTNIQTAGSDQSVNSYFWVNVPKNQTAGTYTADVNVKVYKYGTAP